MATLPIDDAPAAAEVDLAAVEARAKARLDTWHAAARSFAALAVLVPLAIAVLPGGLALLGESVLGTLADCVSSLFLGYIASLFARQKGYDPELWFWATVSNPLALISLALVKDIQKAALLAGSTEIDRTLRDRGNEIAQIYLTIFIAILLLVALATVGFGVINRLPAGGA